jgi:hypothetical protein
MIYRVSVLTSKITAAFNFAPWLHRKIKLITLLFVCGKAKSHKVLAAEGNNQTSAVEGTQIIGQCAVKREKFYLTAH